MRARHRTLPLLPALLCAARLAAQAPAGGHAAVRGTVSAEGHPLAGVLIMRSGTGDSTRSDSAGRYNLANLPRGRSIVQIRKHGYSPLEMELNFPTDTTVIAFDIPMESGAAGDAQLSQKLDREGFNERRRHAQERDRTTFLTADDVEERNAVKLSQLFEGVRDVTVRFENGLAVLYGADGRCTMNVWLEHQYIDNAFPPITGAQRAGVRSFGGSGGGGGRSTGTRYTGLDELIPVTQVGAIEVYPRQSVVPQEFASHGSSQTAQRGLDIETRSNECGAIIVWQR